MKIYKRYKLLFIINCFTIIVFLSSIVYFKVTKYNDYLKINANYIKKNQVRIVVEDKLFKKIEKNPYVYVNTKKKQIKIVSITKNIYREKKKSYHEVFLNLDLERKGNIELSILNKKKEFITMFKECWKEK